MTDTNRTIDGRLINRARHRRQHAFERAEVCKLLRECTPHDFQPDCCATTGELIQTLKEYHPNGTNEAWRIYEASKQVS